MNFQQLRYCEVLARTTSFVRAAEICNVTQSTLSNGVARLEQELGSSIFHRSTRNVSLTAFGEAILASLKDVLNARAALIGKAKELANPDQQIIRIGISPLINSNLTASLVAAFDQKFRSNVILREMNLLEMKRLLDVGQLEFIFGPAAMNDVDPEIQNCPLYTEALIFVPNQNSTHSFSFDKQITLNEIAGNMFLMVPDSCGLSRHTRSLFERNNHSISTYPGHALSYAVLQDWAKIGIGAAILPISKLRPDSPRITICENNGIPARIEYFVYWRDRNLLNTASKEFCKFLGAMAPIIVSGLDFPP